MAVGLTDEEQQVLTRILGSLRDTRLPEVSLRRICNALVDEVGNPIPGGWPLFNSEYTR